MKKQTGTTAAD